MIGHENKFRQDADHLLSDEEFAALMETEFNSKVYVSDALSKQAVWQRLRRSTDQKPVLLLQRSLALVCTFFLVLSISLFPKQYGGSNFSDFRVKSATFPLVNLSAVKMESGEVVKSGASLAVGETLMFKVDSASEFVAALVYKKGDARPEAGFINALIKSGMGQGLRDETHSYGYRTEASDKTIVFCVVVASGWEQLQLRLGALPLFWDRIPKASCVTVSVK